MTTAKFDQNRVPTAIGLLNTDGTTIINMAVDPNSGYINISDGNTGTDHGGDHALRDDNDVPVMMGVSSVDFTTPVAIYIDVSGNLLTKST